jgi:heat shock protein HslJ
MKRLIQNKTQIRIIIMVLLALAFLAACTPTNPPEPPTKPEHMKLYIGPEMVDCEGEGPMKCLLVKFEDDGEWSLFYGNIENFEFEPGFEYELEVTQTELENPPAGGLSIQTELVRVVSKVAVGESVDEAADEPVGLANPASVYCEEQGGTLEIRSDTDGNQYGVCIFADGSECEEWAFFRGECQQGGTESPTNDPLSGTDWDLVSYGDQTPVLDSRPTLQFTPDGLGGSTGCNSFFGGYTLDGNKITFGQMGSTMMACEGLMEQEMAILEMLQSAVSYTLEANLLTIQTPNGDLVYKPKQDLSLEGRIWVLSGIAKDLAIVSTWVDEAITAEFVDGQVTGSGGCNNYFSAYELDENSLTLGPIGSTMMACEEEVSQREIEFFTALEAVAGYKINRSSLTLTDTQGNTLITFQAQGLAP